MYPTTKKRTYYATNVRCRNAKMALEKYATTYSYHEDRPLRDYSSEHPTYAQSQIQKQPKVQSAMVKTWHSIFFFQT